MNRKKSSNYTPNKYNAPKAKNTQPADNVSLLDSMVDGREFESLLKFQNINVDITSEVKTIIAEIQSIRKRPLICYMSNTVNPKINSSISIDNNDDLPFAELIHSIPEEQKEVDIIIVTPGGLGHQVAKFVDKLRPRFDHVTFLLPNIAMSAGTIFSMSGDEIIMDSRAYIGPIDPQLPNKHGLFIPAQALLTLIDEIQEKGSQCLKRGENPPWTDLQILNQIDANEIGNAINYSKYSIELVENFLQKYKFKTWTTHSDGSTVTEEERTERAKYVASLLCEHKFWKSHGRGINRDVAWETCKLKITHPEDIEGLHRSLRRFWALFYWVFENTPVFKVFLSENYCIFRSDAPLVKNT